LEFESANPTIVKSIKQRDLLNTWLRLYARAQLLPRIEEYQPERLAEELPDLVFYTVNAAHLPPRLMIQSDGTRMSAAYGHTGKGRYLDEYLGAKLASVVMPVYHQCLARALPVYTISNIDDMYGRLVAYERLLLPFSDASNVTHVIASLKTICEDGGFEIKNLMRGNDALPATKLCTVIDRDLFHRAPGRIPGINPEAMENADMAIMPAGPPAIAAKLKPSVASERSAIPPALGAPLLNFVCAIWAIDGETSCCFPL